MIGKAGHAAQCKDLTGKIKELGAISNFIRSARASDHPLRNPQEPAASEGMRPKGSAALARPLIFL